jgi:uncharacterized membrane protein YdbT with pleckstrin-like domain
MQLRSIKPSPKYLPRMRLVASTVALSIQVGGFLLAVPLSLSRNVGVSGALLTFFVITILNVAWWLLVLILTGPYHRSLRYEIQDDEVIVHAGIWTKSVKHVPYRTVTNLEVKRDVLDRWLGIGTLNIQTAGMSGQNGAEERLVGLPDVQEVYDGVAAELRRFRGGMAPTQTEVEIPSAVDRIDALDEILAEVRTIRQALEHR